MLCFREFDIAVNERKELILTGSRRKGLFYERNFEKPLFDRV